MSEVWKLASSIDYLQWMLYKVLIIINEKSFPSRFPIDGFPRLWESPTQSTMVLKSPQDFSLLSRFIEWTKFLLATEWAMMHSLIYYSTRTSSMINKGWCLWGGKEMTMLVIILRDDTVKWGEKFYNLFGASLLPFPREYTSDERLLCSARIFVVFLKHFYWRQLCILICTGLKEF